MPYFGCLKLLIAYKFHYFYKFSAFEKQQIVESDSAGHLMQPFGFVEDRYYKIEDVVRDALMGKGLLWQNYNIKVGHLV